MNSDFIMQKKSPRLLSQGYYDGNGLPTISYKETPYRSRKRNRFNLHYPNDDMEMDPFEDFFAENSNSNQNGASNKYKNLDFISILLFFTAISGYALAFAAIWNNPPGNSNHISEPSCKHILEDIDNLRSRVDYLLPEAEFLPNVALSSLGAYVVDEKTSAPYERQTSYFCKLLLGSKTISPKATIEGSPLVPGNCWSFAGEKGVMTIALAYQVPISHVTLGHISPSASPSSSILSAPKVYSIYGMKTVEDEGTFLGTFLYDKDGPRFQTVKIVDQKDQYSFVRLEVISNWGNPDYTCLYNFRVHGKIDQAGQKQEL